MIDSDNFRIICQVVPILDRWVPSLFLVDEVRRSLLHCLETREEMQLEVRRRTIGLNNPKKKGFAMFSYQTPGICHEKTWGKNRWVLFNHAK